MVAPIAPPADQARGKFPHCRVSARYALFGACEAAQIALEEQDAPLAALRHLWSQVQELEATVTHAKAAQMRASQLLLIITASLAESVHCQPAGICG